MGQLFSPELSDSNDIQVHIHTELRVPTAAPAKISADHAGAPSQMELCSHFPSVPLSQGSPENTPGKGVPWIFGKSERPPLAVDKTAKDLDQCPHGTVGSQSCSGLTAGLAFAGNAYFAVRMKQKAKK